MTNIVTEVPAKTLRERMVEDMDLRRLARVTQRNYIRDVGKRCLQAAVYAACASEISLGGRQFHGMSSSQRDAGQSFAILAMTSAM